MSSGRSLRPPLASPVALLLALLAACAPEGPALPRPRLVLLYATCTLDKRFLGAYGDETGLTPNLDAFAADGVVFLRHETESGQSGISFASLFSGTQAHRHGVYHHPAELAEELYLITEAFGDAGWEPWFWSGHPMAAAELGYGQGVPEERVTRVRGRAGKRQMLHAEDRRFTALLDRLEAEPDARAFVLVDFTVTHGLYHNQLEPADYRRFLERHPDLADGLTLADLERAWAVYEEHRLPLQWDYPATAAKLGWGPADEERFARCLELTYRADVEGLDGLFGGTIDLLRERGLLDESLIAFTADHGETLQREGTLFKWTHGFQLAPEVLSVPWILRSPLHAAAGLAPGTWPGVTRSIDVYPTLAGLCGISLHGRGIEGHDLSAALLGRDPAPALLAFSHGTMIGPENLEEFSGYGLLSRYFDSADVEEIWVRLRDGDRVALLRNLDGTRWGTQVFDLAADPGQRTDLFDPARHEHRALVTRLEAYKRLLVEGYRGVRLPADALDRLKELGYVEGE